MRWSGTWRCLPLRRHVASAEHIDRGKLVMANPPEWRGGSDYGLAVRGGGTGARSQGHTELLSALVLLRCKNGASVPEMTAGE